jgi:hypothetical protein
MPDPTTDEFYVGYLPLPAGQRHFLRTLIPLLGLVVAAAAVFIALQQRDPGDAAWDSSTPVTRTGILRTRPYPMLEPALPGSDDLPVLLVESGKHGAQGRADALGDGRPVRVRGLRLHRADREMLELLPSPDGITPMDGSAAAPPADEPLGPATLRGEIVDSKCSLGAMKPGDGKTHKACATLCLTGGIPALFIASDGEEYLLADESGGRIGPRIIAFVGEPVELSGEVVRRGRLLILRVNAASIRRL